MNYATNFESDPQYKSAILAPKPEITPDLARLMEMLSYRRPGGCTTEEDFLDAFIRPLKPTEDAYGNLWLQIGEAPEILWSCHTDTVHKDGGRQKLFLRGSLVFSCADDALGADDTAGVWLLTEMIKAGVPGLYIFHRDEETGCGGSHWIAKHAPELLKGVKYAIALDRRGYTSVITHQFGRCCSDAFAKALAAILGGDFAPDETGLYTDTASYTGLIGECTNLSVGYHDAHSGAESLDLAFIRDLRDTLIAADFSSLVAEREPGEEDEDWLGYETGTYGSAYGSATRRWSGYSSGKNYNKRPFRDRSDALYNLIRDYPASVAAMLEDWGVDDHMLAMEIGVDLEDEYESANEYEDA